MSLVERADTDRIGGMMVSFPLTKVSKDLGFLLLLMWVIETNKIKTERGDITEGVSIIQWMEQSSRGMESVLGIGMSLIIRRC